jgi:Flp pilus assembly pilin Flp
MNALEKRRKAGQGMTEYIIILAIIAIGAILIIGLFGKQIKATFGKSTSAMSGNQADVDAINSDDVTKGKMDDAMKQNDMGTFDDKIKVDSN